MITPRTLLRAAAVFALLIDLPTGDHALPAGAGAAGASGTAGGAETGGTQEDGGNDKGRSIASFVASPIYDHVASKEPPGEDAGPLVSRLRVPCRTLTQTIEVGGQTVPATAVMCRQRDGSWQLNPTQSAQLVPTSDGNRATVGRERPASSGRRCVPGSVIPCGASAQPRRLRVIAAPPPSHAERATDRPNR
jgi:hypothetical protein